MTARKYLKNDALNAQLAEAGYVVVPLLNDDEVKDLVDQFDASHDENIIPFYATAHHESSDFRKQMSQAIIDAISPNVNKLFADCKLLGGSFITKTNSDQSLLQPHQDWNIVDENEFRSFNIWIPLVDLDENNGAIEVLPKSHNWVRGIRHSSIPCAYQNVHHLVWENMKPLYLKAGEALIYDHSLLHASKANKTDDLRIACASGIIPTEAQMRFYWNADGKIEEYESNADYFMTRNIFAKPDGLQKLRDIEYDFPTVDERQFCAFAGLEMPKVEEPEFVESQVEQSTVIEEDTLPFWKVYTPLNIIREINYRLRSR